jgi:hypothetical protein
MSWSSSNGTRGALSSKLGLRPGFGAVLTRPWRGPGAALAGSAAGADMRQERGGTGRAR